MAALPRCVELDRIAEPSLDFVIYFLEFPSSTIQCIALHPAFCGTRVARACIPQPFVLGLHGMQVTHAFEDEGKVGVELIDSEQTPPPSLKLRKESAPDVRPTYNR